MEKKFIPSSIFASYKLCQDDIRENGLSPDAPNSDDVQPVETVEANNLPSFLIKSSKIKSSTPSNVNNDGEVKLQGVTKVNAKINYNKLNQLLYQQENVAPSEIVTDFDEIERYEDNYSHLS